MTIRRTLWLAFLAVGTLVASVVTLLAFLYMRQVLVGHIEIQLRQRAARISGQIDMTLFERLANVATWSRLRIMEELRTRDVDKRLSAFLRDLQQGYGGIYRSLLATDDDGSILAASDPRWLGRRLGFHPARRRIAFNEQTIEVLPLPLFNGLAFRTRIGDGAGQALGWLYAVVDWEELRRFLDQTTVDGVPQIALLADGNSRVIAASRVFPGRIEGDLSQVLVPLERTGLHLHRLQVLDGLEVVLGSGHSPGYRGFPGFGWRVVLMSPAAEILAPLGRLWLSLGVFFALALLVSGFLAYVLAARIAGPLTRLTAFVSRFPEERGGEVPEVAGSREVVALSRAFGRMMQRLERSRRDLVRASKLAVVGEMAAIMAHEVRTPLGILRSAAEMLQRERGLSAVGGEMVQYILSETERLKGLVTTLLDCARPRPSQFVSCDPGSLAGQVADLLDGKLRHRGVTLELAPAEEASIECDPDHLVQVFLNLILNALQHVGEGGRIAVRNRLEGHHWHVWVCDDGPGVPPEIRERVFDPFFTRREGGIGLGLTVVQQIVRSHGGDIRVEDGFLAGACFHFWLPRTQQQRED